MIQSVDAEFRALILRFPARANLSKNMSDVSDSPVPLSPLDPLSYSFSRPAKQV